MDFDADNKTAVGDGKAKSRGNSKAMTDKPEKRPRDADATRSRILAAARKSSPRMDWEAHAWTRSLHRPRPTSA